MHSEQINVLERHFHVRYCCIVSEGYEEYEMD